MAITERYACFDTPAGGLNDGSSEANAWETPADVVFAAGERVNLKSNTRYALTASWNIATSGSATQPIYLRGYNSTIGDGGDILLSVSAWIRIYVTGNIFFIEGTIDLTSSGVVGNQVFYIAATRGHVEKLKIVKTTTGQYTVPIAVIGDGSIGSLYVESYGNSTSTAAAVYVSGGIINNAEIKCVNGQRGMELNHGYQVSLASKVLIYSLVSTTAAGIYISGLGTDYGMLLNHFTIDGFDDGLVFNTLPTSNAIFCGFGIISGAVDAISTNEATTKTGVSFQGIAFYNNTNDYSDMGDNVVINPIACTADPYTDSANGDFSLNNTAGGGALLKGVVPFGAN